jgi:DNA-binding Lrp family transcriptional regulator
MNAKMTKRIRRNGQHYSLFFIRPKVRTDVHRYAERLASMEDVAEVMVTTGECGFIVKTKGSDMEQRTGKDPFIAKNSYKKITCYYQYRR